MGTFASLQAMITVVTITAHRCELYNLAMPYGGRYCIAEGAITQRVLSHQCRLTCIQLSKCRAYNYNFTDETCTRFTATCLLAYSDPVMEFVVFRETPVHQCYEWVTYNSGDPLDERMIAADNPERIVSRLAVSGSDVVGYFFTVKGKCYGTVGDREYYTWDGYLCERLRVIEGCTIFWVPYTAGETLPSNAVIGGAMANGDVPYVVKFDVIHDGKMSISAYYIEGFPYAITGYYGTRHSATMMMMVVL